MKAVMYHYVRPRSGAMPFFRYLDLADFRAQLDWFAASGGFVSRDQFLEGLETGVAPPGYVLTFDDGLQDHYEHVVPELVRRKLWGLFYIVTDPLATRRMLDVHRIHVLLGSCGGARVLEAMREVVDEGMLPDGASEEFRTRTYTQQENDAATQLVKRTLNYYISHAARTAVLDALFERLLGDQERYARSFYVDAGQVREMQAAGMVVGSHSCSHPVFSKLAPPEQESELARSFAFLEDVTGGLPVRSFCYPYGGFHTFTDETEALLGKLRCRFAFNVEPRDIGPADLVRRPQALPRYDCNAFPHGRARLGEGY